MKSPKSPYPPNDQVTPAETAVLLDLAAACLHLPGDWVEFGCYKGDTSVLLGRLLQQHHPISPPPTNSTHPPTTPPASPPPPRQSDSAPISTRIPPASAGRERTPTTTIAGRQ